MLWFGAMVGSARGALSGDANFRANAGRWLADVLYVVDASRHCIASYWVSPRNRTYA
jgi:hypothetical protein